MRRRINKKVENNESVFAVMNDLKYQSNKKIKEKKKARSKKEKSIKRKTHIYK